MPRSLRIALLPVLATLAAAAPASAAPTLSLGEIAPATQTAGGDVLFGDVHMTAYSDNEASGNVVLTVFLDTAACAADKAAEAAQATAQPGISKVLSAGIDWHTFSLTPPHEGGTFNVCAYTNLEEGGSHLAAAPAKSFTATRLPDVPATVSLTLPTPGDQAVTSLAGFEPIRWTATGTAPYGNAMLEMWLSERTTDPCVFPAALEGEGMSFISGSTVSTGAFSVDFDVSPDSAGVSRVLSFSRTKGVFASATPRTLCAFLTRMPPAKRTAPLASSQGGQFKLTPPAAAQPATPPTPSPRVIKLPARRFAKSGKATVEILLGRLTVAKATKRVRKGRKVVFSFTLTAAQQAALDTAGPKPKVIVRTTLKPKKGRKSVTRKSLTLG